jgi:hypothetical protein
MIPSMRLASFGGMTLATLAFAAACGGTTSNAPASGSGAAGAGAGAEAGAGAPAGGTPSPGTGGVEDIQAPRMPCRSDVPSPEQIAATPRPFPNLEQLALKLSKGIVADQLVYDRVVRDVTSIHEQAPDVRDIGYFPADDGRSLILSLDAATLADLQANLDTPGRPWSCLNDTYVLVRFLFGDAKLPYAVLTLKGIYDLQQVAAQYAKIPGVASAEPDIGGGDGSTICLTQDGETWHYVFDRASGDCLAGCIDHEFTHFSTDRAGQVVRFPNFTPEDQARYASAEACR